jgi:hypothetical protein
MKTADLAPIPQRSDFPEAERTAPVKGRLPRCQQQQEQLAQQAEQLALQAEQIQQLKDEIAILKGEKARPQLKPSRLTKDPPSGSDQEGDESKGRRRGKPSRKKTQALKIHDERIVQPPVIPPGAIFKGYAA